MLQQQHHIEITTAEITADVINVEPYEAVVASKTLQEEEKKSDDSKTNESQILTKTETTISADLPVVATTTKTTSSSSTTSTISEGSGVAINTKVIEKTIAETVVENVNIEKVHQDETDRVFVVEEEREPTNIAVVDDLKATNNNYKSKIADCDDDNDDATTTQTNQTEKTTTTTTTPPAVETTPTPPTETSVEQAEVSKAETIKTIGDIVNEEKSINGIESETLAGHAAIESLITYNEGQWSPENLSGKKQYDRAQLLQLREAKLSRVQPTTVTNAAILPQANLMPSFVRNTNSGNSGSHKRVQSMMGAIGGGSSMRGNSDASGGGAGYGKQASMSGVHGRSSMKGSK